MMDNLGLKSGETQQQQSQGVQPACAPTPSTHVQQPSLGHSVVPDLMKIYESLTQSKTPDFPGGVGTMQDHRHQHQAYQQQQQQQLHPYAHHAMYSMPDASNTQQQQFIFAPPPYGGYNAQQHEQYSTELYTGTKTPSYEQSYEESTTAPIATGSSSGRSLRKRSSDMNRIEDGSDNPSTTSSEGPIRARKKKKSDGRWSKRFTWPDDLHRDFVAAVFDVGLKHASPSAILEHMPEHEQINSERVKSHLQKYRLHREKSKKEFMSQYEASLSNYHATGIQSNALSSGQVAAHLTYSALTENEDEEAHQGQASLDGYHQQKSPESSANPHDVKSGTLVLPKLTEAEMHSPIGASMGYLMGLFFSLRQQLLASRSIPGTTGASGSSALGGDGTANQVVTTTTQDSLVPVIPYVSYPSHADNEAEGGKPHDPTAAVRALPPPMTTSSNVGQDLVEPFGVQDVSSGASTSTATASAHPTSSTRTNLEESHLMKREMQNQMAFQNKMRALKQQELNKYKTVEKEPPNNETVDDTDGPTQTSYDGTKPQHDEDHRKDHDIDDDEGNNQESGETAEVAISSAAMKPSARNRGLSVGTSEDFWVNDEQLFEFLMDP